MAKNWDSGNVVEIDLGKGRVGYGMVIEFPLVAFFDLYSEKEEKKEMEEVLSTPIIFKIWVMKYAIGRKGWRKIGRKDLSEDEKKSPWFYKYDTIGKYFSLMRGYEEKRAKKEECLDLECAAVWDPEHVVSRLNGYFDGKPNKSVDALSAKNINTEPVVGGNE